MSLSTFDTVQNFIFFKLLRQEMFIKFKRNDIIVRYLILVF